MNYITNILILLLEVLKWLVLARVLLSWLPMAGARISPYNPVIQFLTRVTDPILRPLRPFSRMGTMDFSPIIAFFIIGFVQKILGGMSIAQLVALAISLTIAFSVHEFSHAWVAYKSGDSTAKNQGRLTMNPLKHLDVLGTIMVLAVGFGWAKPVPVNPYALRSGPKAGMATVAVAGPLSNLALAILAAIPLRLGVIESTSIFSSGLLDFFIPTMPQLFFTFIWLNVILLVFNLLPIAPLDGFKVLLGFLPYPASEAFRKSEPFGPLILLLLVFLPTGLTTLLSSITNWIVGILI